VKHYPGRWAWVAAGVALIAPLSLRGIWRRFRLRGVSVALLIAAGAALAISEAEEKPESLVGIAFRYGANLQPGQKVGLLAFPRFDKTVPVRAGFDQAEIDRGPSWYPRGQLPGAGGTTYIAAHRLTHGGPFREIGDLRRGDRVIFTTPYAIATYSVMRHALTSERRTSILVSGQRNELRLQASTIPAGHYRLVVFARLETIERR
jgi:LPXTG-site transpeptidase (sortase) family protein